MTGKRTMLMILFVGLFFQAFAQKTAPSAGATPRDMWEVGASAGYLFVSGDVNPDAGYGFGLHVRKATDYIFSLRMDLLYGHPKGSGGDRFFNSKWFSGTVFGVLSFNSLRWDKPVRKTNFYAMLGAGANSFKTNFSNEEVPRKETRTIMRELASHASLGAGLSIRLSKRVNIAVEHQASILFGRRSDLLDGTENEKGVRTPFRDILNYSNIAVNVNIGNASNKSEPLYWINPLEVVLNDISDLKARPKISLEDSDGDGIIDALDQEPDTPPDAPVDTKGRTLDSDHDGVADYMDKEPYYPPRAGEQVDNEGVVVNPISRRGVSEDRVKELIEEALRDFQASGGSSSVAEWFLPMIHFGIDSYRVKYADYGTLASIATMMKANPRIRLVITGYTDQTAPESHNNSLSYSRADAIIAHLVEKGGIGRGRLVLQWKGEAEALVPSSSSYMNRRVDFRVASANDVEMDPPQGYKGRKRSGY